jgi:hypothetical protein
MSGTHWQDDPPEDPRDDWLAEPDATDWDEPPARDRLAGEEEGAARPARRPDGAGTSGGVSPEVRRRRQILALVVGALVVIVVVAVVFATRGGGSKQPTALTPPPPPATTTSAGQPATPPPAPPASGPTGPAAGQNVAKVTLPAGGSLRSGDSGPEVVKLQKALAALGLKVGNPDGTFGPATKAAVVAFQTSHKLSPDGIVGAATAKKLNDALAASG